MQYNGHSSRGASFFARRARKAPLCKGSCRGATEGLYFPVQHGDPCSFLSGSERGQCTFLARTRKRRFSRATCARGCSFLYLKEKNEKKQTSVPLDRRCIFHLSAFCGAAVSQASTGRHTPKGTADKTVSARHSANNAALRQIYFVQTLLSCTHRVPIMAKFYLMRHALTSGLNSTDFCPFPMVDFAKQNRKTKGAVRRRFNRGQTSKR